MDVEWITIPKSRANTGFTERDLERLAELYPVLGPEWYAPCACSEVDIEAFQIAKYPVTWQDFCSFLNCSGNNAVDGMPWFWEESPYSLILKSSDSYKVRTGADLHPVTGVSVDGARAYAEFASARLPTKSEWECAARDQTMTLWPWGDCPPGDQCNHWEAEPVGRVDVMINLNDGRGTTPVDVFEPNRLGIFDMLGNVWEWCDTGRSDGSAVLKGGCWNDILPIVTLPGFEHSVPRHYRITYTFGLRLARSL